MRGSSALGKDIFAPQPASAVLAVVDPCLRALGQHGVPGQNLPSKQAVPL